MKFDKPKLNSVNVREPPIIRGGDIERFLKRIEEVDLKIVNKTKNIKHKGDQTC